MRLEEIGPKYRSLREHYGLTVRGLAYIAGVSPTTIQNIERGSDCRFSVLRRVALQLGGDVEIKFAATPSEGEAGLATKD